MQDQEEFSSSYDPRSWLASTPPDPAIGRADHRPGAGIAPSSPISRPVVFGTGAVWLMLLLLGAVAAFLGRDELPPKPRPAPAVPSVVLRTVTADQPWRVADALVAAGMPPREANRISRQAGDALRPGDRQIRLTIDTARGALVRLEATSADGSRLRLDRDGRR